MLSKDPHKRPSALEVDQELSLCRLAKPGGGQRAIPLDRSRDIGRGGFRCFGLRIPRQVDFQQGA